MAGVTAPKTLADEHIKVMLLTTPPKSLKAITLAEVKAGYDISCRVLKSGYKAGATASEQISGQAALCEATNASIPGQSNYEVNMSPFRWFNASKKGQADPTEDRAFQMLKEKGVTLYMVERRTGKKYDEEWEAGDEYNAFEIVTDNPVAQDDTSGYIYYNTVPLVQSAELFKAIAA